jgi:hypothetical protein
MARLWKSHSELGLAVQAAQPNNVAVQGMNAEELGRITEPKLTGGDRVVDEYSDIDFGNMLGNVGDSWEGVWDESWDAMSEIASHPWEKGVKPMASLVGGGLSEMGRQVEASPASDRRKHSLIGMIGKGLDASGLVDDEDRKLARDAYSQFKESFDPATIEQDPMRTLADATSVLPWGPGHIRRAGLLQKLAKGSKAGKVADMALSVASPDLAAEQAITASFQLGKEGVKQAVKHTPEVLPEVLKKLGRGAKESAQSGRIRKSVIDPIKTKAEPVVEFAKNLRVGDRPLTRETAATAAAITTGRSRTWVDRLFTKRGDEAWRKQFRLNRQKDEPVLAGEIQEKSLTAVNKLQKQMSEMYGAATEKFFSDPGGGPMLETGDLRDHIVRSLGLVDVKVRFPKTAEPRRATDRFGVEDFGEYTPRTSNKVELDFTEGSITELGSARKVLTGEIGDLLNALQTGSIPAKELHRRRKLIDDAISTLNANTDISKTARKAMLQVRDNVADFVEAGMGDDYKRLMSDYRKHVILRDNLGQNLGLEPGQIDKYGNVTHGTQERLLRGLESTVSEDNTVSGRRLQAIEELERVTKTKGIVDLEMARMAQAWAGGGLIVRNEIAQIGRGILATATTASLGALGGVLLAIPGAALFSPRLMSEAILMPTGPLKESVKSAVAGMSRSAKRRFQKRIERVTQTMNRLDDMTGGDLRRTAIRENWNVAQMLERMELPEE